MKKGSIKTRARPNYARISLAQKRFSYTKVADSTILIGTIHPINIDDDKEDDEFDERSAEEAERV